jgi:hypothetical protein
MELSGSGCRFRVNTTGRAKVSIQSGVGGVENQMAIPAFAQVALNLAFHGGREFSL